jgi:anti-sigma regulatory factor (Ser/Thr protein kinase)
VDLTSSARCSSVPGRPNAWSAFSGNPHGGLRRAVSTLATVARDHPSLPASSSCFQPCRSRRLRDVQGVLLKDVRLRNRPEAAAGARQEVVATARLWGPPHEILDSAETCVSELVTNSVKYAAGMPDSTLRLLVTRREDRLRVEVHDSSRVLPSGQRPEPYGESGRGLFIVGSMAVDHGAHLTPTGKAVWFELVAWPVAPP